MGFVLKETLKSLCCNNGWSYGVFWRFDQRNFMLLTTEDSYFEEEMGVLAKNMLSKAHMLGEGIVGQAALSGNKKWIFSDVKNGCLDILQNDSEIHYQFSSGLKTIAIIPVESRGVVQFGSTHKILETSEFSDQAKRLLSGMDDINGINLVDNPPSNFNYDCDLIDWFASFCNGNITPATGGSCNELMELAFSSTNLTQSSAFQSDFKQENMNSLSMDSSRFTNQMPTPGIDPQITFSGELQQLFSGLEKSSEEYKLDEFAIAKDQSNCFLADNLFEWFSSPLDNDISKVTLAINELVSKSAGLVGNASPEIPFTQQANSIQSSITDARYDPLKDLGVRADYRENMKPVKNFGHLATSSSVSECVSDVNSAANGGPKKGLFSELGLEELLNGGNSSSYITNSSVDDQFLTAKRKRLENPSLNQVLVTNLRSEKEIFPKSQVGLWIGDSYSINNEPAILAKPKKQEEPTKAVRKRARPGESTRPRPKDRQQIQDRMRELKGIIPDGAKCSIDALLDRTIKYMLFLQSVIKYADKIKQADEPKLIGEANKPALKENTTNSSGATWALEVGEQSMVCPIIVEDLSPPGLMLIEMLCEDRGFFLEIADVIRGFGLNILKGVMETREDKIWAHFIVEANTHLTRIDIFWSLVQLLQLTSTTGMDLTNQPSNAITGRVPHMNNYQQPALPGPISIMETLQ